MEDDSSDADSNGDMRPLDAANQDIMMSINQMSARMDNKGCDSLC
jgi:hypothetical protein